MFAAPVTSSPEKSEARRGAAPPDKERKLYPRYNAFALFPATKVVPSGTPRKKDLRGTARPGLVIQTKLRISQPGDQYEREADWMAEHVMRMPAGKNEASSRSSRPPERTLLRKCSHCEEEEKKVQRKKVDGSPGGGLSAVHEVLNTPGEPLSGTLRSFMEPRFGFDFSGVRVHYDAHAAESAKAVRALAYTAGQHVVFGAGQYSAESMESRKLLAHELSHVIQQGGAKQYPGRASRHGGFRYSRAERGQHLHRSPITGGNILYVGMNNYMPEVQQLRSTYAGTSVKVTTVTVTEHEEKTQVGGVTYDLTQDSGINAFVDSLKLAKSDDADALKKLISAQSTQNRDDLVHVISVYAATEADGVDRMSRVVLSGHSYGDKIYNEEVKGAIYFDALIKLAQIFPKAAGQTKHLLVLACLAGDKDQITNIYQKAYPNMHTFWGWTRATCPTGAGAAAALAKWTTLTDKDPTTMPLPPDTQATWAMGVYQTNDPVDAKAIMSGLRTNEAKFNEYFNGNKVDRDAHSGDLFEYYQQARIASLHVSEITGADHDYAQLHADQSYRLRFWPGMVSNFWKRYGTAVQAGYGTTKAPDYSKMSRKDALAAIVNFASVATATGKDRTEAERLLGALRDLNANVLEGEWIKP
ncbi:MAG TPA: DUF4157 domain-containing protein [Pseudacidobacterium sp.]|jgi:hypothetical protein|nr:DUF4157 domain-containing protein [Pseudacidobacterium sp.]